MTRYILDTNLFFNMEARMGLGDTTINIVHSLKAVSQNVPKDEFEHLAPPAIVQEITTFFDTPDDHVLQDILGFLTVKSPSISTQSLPASIVAALIEDYRQRAYRSMKVAEEEVIRGAELFMGKEVLPHKEFQMACGKILTKMRERFRTATRTGTIDSAADFDLIMLALEQDAFLVSTDEGVMHWARQIGVKEMSSVTFGKKMKAYL